MKQIQITRATQFDTAPPTDMTAAQVSALTYAVLIDTVDPPVKSYAVPAAKSAAAVGNVITVTPADLGFTAAAGTKYFIEATETSGALVSKPSVEVVWVEPAPPLAPSVAVS